VKIVGIYLALALILGLLVRPLVSEAPPGSHPSLSKRYGRTVTGAALFALAFVVVLMSGGLVLSNYVGLLVPIAALCGAVALLGWRGEWNLPGTQPRGVLGEIGIFLAGCALPVALLAVPYLLTGSLSDLVEGTLVAPRSRFEFATFDMPPPAELGWALPLVVLLVARPRMSKLVRTGVDAAAGACMVFFALTASSSDVSYSVLWNMSRALAPFVLVLGAVVLFRSGRVVVGNDGVVATVVLVAGFWTLVQFPFSAPVYFCYVAPLVMLAAISSTRALGLADGLLPALVLVCLVSFGARQLDRQGLSSLGREFQPDPQVAILDHKRASIRILPEDKRVLDRVRELVARHGAPPGPIFAGPDAPEVYFLTQSRNVTPSIIDFLDRTGTTRGAKLIGLLRNEGIRLVVVNHKPSQSPELTALTIDRIRDMYPLSQRVGKFEVRWK
jgi:hypothetical protein